MELCNIYCGFWERMKEISVGLCINEYTWLKIWEKKKKKKSGLFKKTKWKRKKKEKGLEQKKKNEKEKNRSAIWTLLCKVSGIGIIWKEKLCSISL